MKSLILFALALVPSVAQAQSANWPTPVAAVDLERYSGLWFEIARIPNRFQSDCVGAATANYEIRDDGRIDVVNRCLKEDGGMKEARGIGRLQEEATAKLEVSFFSIVGWRPIWGDYWILDLGGDYEYAVIGDRGRNYGWILSRSRALSQDKLAELFEGLSQQGYDPEEFVLVQDSAASPPPQ